MKRFTVHMRNGTTIPIYAYEFLRQEDDAAYFDIGLNTDYILYGVESVEG